MTPPPANPTVEVMKGQVVKADSRKVVLKVEARKQNGIGPTPTSPVASKAASPPAREEIARRAYELFQEEGSVPGKDVEHWLRAEAELRRS